MLDSRILDPMFNSVVYFQGIICQVSNYSVVLCSLVPYFSVIYVPRVLCCTVLFSNDVQYSPQKKWIKPFGGFMNTGSHFPKSPIQLHTKPLFMSNACKRI